MNVTHFVLITDRRFLSTFGRLQVRLASGGAVLGYVFNNPNGPCVPFAILATPFPHSTLLQDWTQYRFRSGSDLF